MSAIKEDIPMQLKKTLKQIFSLVQKRYPDLYECLHSLEKHVDSTDSIHMLDFILEQTTKRTHEVYLGIKPQKQSLLSSVLLPYETLTTTDDLTILLLRIKISEYLGRCFMYDCINESKSLVKKLKTFKHECMGTSIIIIPEKTYEITQEESNDLYFLDLLYMKYLEGMENTDPEIKVYTTKNMSETTYQLYQENKYMIAKSEDGFQIAI